MCNVMLDLINNLKEDNNLDWIKCNVDKFTNFTYGKKYILVDTNYTGNVGFIIDDNGCKTSVMSYKEYFYSI